MLDFCELFSSYSRRGAFVESILYNIGYKNPPEGSSAIRAATNINQPSRHLSTFDKGKKTEVDIKKYTLPAEIKEDKLHYLYRYLFNESTENKNLCNILERIVDRAFEESDQVQKIKSTIDLSTFWNNTTYYSNKAFKSQNADSELNPMDVAKKQFDDIVNLYTRWKKYVDTEKNRVSIPITLVCAGESISSLYKTVYENSDKSFFIHGKGGAGKTHLFIELFEKMIKEQIITPFYIPLNSVQPTKYKNSIIGELSEHLRNPQNGNLLSVDEIDKMLRESDTPIFILADGLNEVTESEKREIIARELSEIASVGTYPNVHIMLSSRIPHTSWFKSKGLTEFVEMKIEELNEDDIKNYLAEAKCPIAYNKIDKNTKKLLRTAMGLSMYAELTCSGNVKQENLRSLGDLLQSYLCFLLGVNSYKKHKNFLYKVAHNMMSRYEFTIREHQLERIEGYSIDALKELESILSLQNNDEYTFSHQNFRDMLVAKSYATSILNLEDNVSNVCNVIKTDYITKNSEILLLVSDFLKGENKTLQRIINGIPKENTSFQLSILIQLFALSNNNSIAELSLDGHDLSHIRLSGFKLFDSENKLSVSNCNITTATFSMPGLTRASSAITSFTIDGQTSIIAFGNKSCLIYDANTGKKTVQIFKKTNGEENLIGDVGCCCYIDNGDNPYLLIGTDNGLIHQYDIKARKLTFAQWSISDKKPIWSIVESNNNVYFTKKISQKSFGLFNLENHLDTIAEIELSDEYIKEIENKLISINKGRLQARLAVSTNGVLYCIYGNELYKYLDGSLQKINLIAPDGIIKQQLFIDIAITKNYIFINNVEHILVFKLSENQHGPDLTYIDKVAIEDYKDDSGDFFTKFSKTNKDNSILVGIGRRGIELRGSINFIEISADKDSNKRGKFKVTPKPIHGKHTFTTHTGVYFTLDSTDSTEVKTYIATVADDRTMQIICKDDEDFEVIQIPGEYNGVRSIQAISDVTLICGNYDGCITKWEFIDDGWYCTSTCKVHNNWIEEIKLLELDDNTSFVISTSRDGCVNLTDLDGCRTKTMLKLNKAAQDLSVMVDDNAERITIVAITDNKVYYAMDFPLQEMVNWFEDDKDISLLYKEDTKGDNNNLHALELSDYGSCRAAEVKEQDQLLIIGNDTSNQMSRVIALIQKNPNELISISSFFCRCSIIFENYLLLVGNIFNQPIGKMYLYRLLPQTDEPQMITSYTFEKANDICAASVKHSDGKFIITTCHKDKKYCTFEYSEGKELKLIQISEPISNISEAVCLTESSNNRFVGTVGGEIVQIDSENHVKPIIQIRANLISNGMIEIENADEVFKNHFEGYFDFI